MPSFFKYIADPDSVQFLLKGICKFTPIPELNDPSELVPSVIVDDVKASLARLRRDGYSENDMVHLRQQGFLLQRLAPQFQAIDVPTSRVQATAVIRRPFYNSIDLLIQLLNKTAREISSKVGLFCLSRRYDSLPMWAHYASNARGLVVEFVELDKIFPGDDTGVLRKPIAVRYERESWGVSFEPQSHESLFLSKFQDWGYEEEVRVVLPLAECRQEVVRGNLFYFYDLPAPCIARIILGWNTAPDKVDAVHAFTGTLNPGVEIVQARVVRGRVEIEGGSAFKSA